MGQYYQIVNIDKEEYLHPHDLHAGLKAIEFTSSNVPKLLAYLLTSSTGGGGGDFRPVENPEYEGRWAGDRIAITGDYDESGLGLTAEENDHAQERLSIPYKERQEWDVWAEQTGQQFVNLYGKAQQTFTNISEPAMAEYNEAVDVENMQIHPPMYEQDATYTVVGTHPENLTVLAEGVEYHDARAEASEYSREYGWDFVELHDTDDLGEESNA